MTFPSASGEKMSNVFQDHPWLNYVAVALATSIVNSAVGKIRKVFTSPGREDFQQLERRISAQFTELGTRIDTLGDKVYQRIDEKCDQLNERIDTIVLRQNGGR